MLSLRKLYIYFI